MLCNIKTESIFAYHFLFYLAGKSNIKQLTKTYKCINTWYISNHYICISRAADPWHLMITPPSEIAISQKNFNVEWV